MATRHTADGTKTLNQLAASLGISGQKLIQDTLANSTPAELSLFWKYLGTGLMWKGLAYYTDTAPPPPGTAPHGPGGNWNLAWADEFNGTSLDTSKWWPAEGIQIAHTQLHQANLSVANGCLNLKFAGSNNGAGVVSARQVVQGWFQPSANGHALAVGECAEARINFPGSSGGTVWNWPAWWFLCSDSNAGEIDLAEGLGGSLTVNYHSNSGASNGPAPGGTWANGFHTYTVVRHAASFDAYWDGNLAWSHATADDGYPMCMILNNSSGQYGGPETPGAVVQVDYVRVWTPA